MREDASLLLGDFANVAEVALVADEQLRHSARSVFVQF